MTFQEVIERIFLVNLFCIRAVKPLVVRGSPLLFHTVSS